MLNVDYFVILVFTGDAAAYRVYVYMLYRLQVSRSTTSRPTYLHLPRMWNLKCTIIPIITGAIGIVTRSLRKNLEAVPGKHLIDSLLKTAILGTSHIIRKVLQCEA